MQLAILGASGHGRVLADVAHAAGWQRIEFFDDNLLNISSVQNWHVGGNTKQLISRIEKFDGVIVGIGNCTIRGQMHRLLKSAGGRLVTIVHPRAWVSPHAKLGDGCVVMAGAVINIGASIGDAGIVNTGATVDHDCILGEAVHISPGAHLAGDVRIGNASWIGIGAAVRQGIAIGSGVMVGAGAVVVKPIPDGETVIGNPAMPLRRG